jgi:hypothetical protein
MGVPQLWSSKGGPLKWSPKWGPLCLFPQWRSHKGGTPTGVTHS